MKISMTGGVYWRFPEALKNARDAFDSHFGYSKRIGWRTLQRTPNPLSAASKKTLLHFADEEEETVWRHIEPYAKLDAIGYPQVFRELISLQESEAEYRKAKTEGGRKMVVSHRIEREPSLRNDAIKIHGYNCMVCGFNFESVYGECVSFPFLGHH